MAIQFQTPDPNERFRARRHAARRRRQLRRAVAAALLLSAATVLALGVSRVGGEPAAPALAKASGKRGKPAAAVPVRFAPLPKEMRGVHVTMALASLPGKLEEYLGLARVGLNTLEVDVKDENGDVAFVPSAVPLAAKVGAARPYYEPREVARMAEQAGVYLIGRVVVFEDPRLSQARPELAIRRADGSVWTNDAGLGWANPYDRRVWEYNVAIAAVAARSGFDEIQFDYVRFPTDGPADTVFPYRTATPPGWVIAEFARYASKRLRPLGVRVSADVFGLAATRDLGIGQVPRRLAKYLDAIYPMTYPSHYVPGEYGLADPNAVPGETVSWSLSHFKRELRGRKARLVPWLQDFSLGRTYTLADVRAQIDAARLAQTDGFLLWNPLGVYTEEALRPS